MLVTVSAHRMCVIGMVAISMAYQEYASSSLIVTLSVPLVSLAPVGVISTRSSHRRHMAVVADTAFFRAALAWSDVASPRRGNASEPEPFGP